MKSRNKLSSLVVCALLPVLWATSKVAMAQYINTSVNAPDATSVVGFDTTNGTSFTPASVGAGQYGTTTAGDEIIVAGSDAALGDGASNVNAYTTYGQNHEASSFGQTTNPYFYGGATSQWTDTLIETSTSSLGPAEYAQLTFTIDGSLSGSALTTFGVDTTAARENLNLYPATGGSASETGSLTAEYGSYVQNTLFGPVTHDGVSISGPGTYAASTTPSNDGTVSGTVQLVTDYLQLTSAGDLTISATLETQLDPEALGYLAPGSSIQGSANFEQTAALTGISFFNSNDVLIPNADITLTSASGTVYPQGLAPAPETPTLTSLAAGLAVLGLLYLRRHKHAENV